MDSNVLNFFFFKKETLRRSLRRVKKKNESSDKRRKVRKKIIRSPESMDLIDDEENSAHLNRSSMVTNTS